mmetsp:Transcript_129360/g.258265  ORF Transcript_129360/g.258265 Transcript_129360/m.258265 type:complete len:415 (-) Transcript_129360:439-1683(-)
MGAVKKSMQLVLNAGSSSVKYAVYSLSGLAGKPVWNCLVEGLAEGIGTSNQCRIKHETENGKEVHKTDLPDHRTAMKQIMQLLPNSYVEDISSIGHRVVHGGESFSDAAVIDATVVEHIKQAAALAPLHNPWNLLGIEVSAELFGASVPQVAVFDTAFHQTLPKHAFLYALPMEFYEKHRIRRYGFHGTSYKYVSEETARMLQKPPNEVNMIACHIGNGASMCAIQGGKSIDTTMGLTPLEGLVMGTRCGDIDPAVPLHLMTNLGYTAEEVNTVLNKKSGFLGLCGTMDDREVEDGTLAGDSLMTLTKQVQIHRMRRYLGAYMVALSGQVDALVFTAGLGEKSHLLRTLVCQDLAALGFEVDEEKNKAKGGRFSENTPIHKEGSKIQIWVVPTAEELSIAQQTYWLLEQAEPVL